MLRCNPCTHFTAGAEAWKAYPCMRADPSFASFTRLTRTNQAATSSLDTPPACIACPHPQVEVNNCLTKQAYANDGTKATTWGHMQLCFDAVGIFASIHSRPSWAPTLSTRRPPPPPSTRRCNACTNNKTHANTQHTIARNTEPPEPKVMPHGANAQGRRRYPTRLRTF